MTEFLTQVLSGEQGTLGFSQLLVSMVFAYLGGILSSLTPCVYPMIPITVSVIGGMGGKPAGNGNASAKKSWRELYLRALAYVLGMSVIYSILGVLAGVSGRVFGSFTSNSIWYLGLGLIMTVAALIMLDVIPFDPMVWWESLKQRFQNRFKRHKKSRPASAALVQKEMTLAGAFFLGASSGFIAAPCTTPVLTSILTYIAKTRSVGQGFCLMLSFSFGLGTILLALASFTGAVRILPRSGRWMNAVKTGSGLILLAFAEYLIYRAGTFGGL